MGSDRIESVEIALAHAEAEIESLSETCRAQWAEIDALKAEVAKLVRTLEALLTTDEGETPPADAKPPHY